MIIMIIKVSIRVSSCACFISTNWILCRLHYGRQVHCGRQQQQGGQDQGGPLARFFQNLPKGPKTVQSVLEWSKSIFQVFLTVTHLLDHFWTALDTFRKKGLKVMSASSLVLSSLLSLPSTVHLPATV